MSPERVISHVIAIEGGYVNDPKDPGGETKYGICKRSYPDLDIKNLTVEQATAIYIQDYWTPLKCSDLPIIFRLVVFDCGVNQGVYRAAKMLQRALGVKQDGIIGNITLRRASAYPSKEKFYQFVSYRAVAYLGTVIVRPKSRKYFRGWMKRLIRVSVETFYI